MMVYSLSKVVVFMGCCVVNDHIEDVVVWLVTSGTTTAVKFQ